MPLVPGKKKQPQGREVLGTKYGWGKEGWREGGGCIVLREHLPLWWGGRMEETAEAQRTEYLLRNEHQWSPPVEVAGILI